ncbi:MAG: hypothetical protein ACR2J8_02395, partial [Thermomicrobiales bacterium]
MGSGSNQRPVAAAAVDTANAGPPPPPSLDWPTRPGVARGLRMVFLVLLALGIALIAFALFFVTQKTGIGSFQQTDRTWAWIVAGLVSAARGLVGLVFRPEVGSASCQV